jgi:glycosyltransferase involved in cell wall biosynthesis
LEGLASRILITTPVFPPELGGPATFVPHFAAHLRERGHTVSVLSYTDEPSAVADYPFPVSLIRRRFLPFRACAFFVACLRLAWRSDLVFVCEHPALFSVLAAKICRRPVVLRVMVNSAWELCYRFGLTREDPDRFLLSDGNWMVRAIKRLEAATLRRADLVVAVSRHLGETAERLGVPRECIFVSYNLSPPASAGAQVEPSDATERVDVASDTFLLLVVARLVNWKGVDTVISALAELPPRFRLIVVGEGPMETQLKGLTARLGLGDRVTFVGRVDNRTVCQHMKVADLLVLNSVYEGLSHVLLEAMTTGLPILASDVPGNRELVEHGDNGILFAANDGTALRYWIESLSGSPDRLQQMRRRGRERAREISGHHTFERLARKLEDIGAARVPDA